MVGKGRGDGEEEDKEEEERSEEIQEKKIRNVMEGLPNR